MLWRIHYSLSSFPQTIVDFEMLKVREKEVYITIILKEWVQSRLSPSFLQVVMCKEKAAGEIIGHEDTQEGYGCG